MLNSDEPSVILFPGGGAADVVNRCFGKEHGTVQLLVACSWPTRLYLYRSFRREDVKDNDVRARLLDHFAAPLRRDPEKKGRETERVRFRTSRFRPAGWSRLSPDFTGTRSRLPDRFGR